MNLDFCFAVEVTAVPQIFHQRGCLGRTKIIFFSSLLISVTLDLLSSVLNTLLSRAELNVGLVRTTVCSKREETSSMFSNVCNNSPF